MIKVWIIYKYACVIDALRFTLTMYMYDHISYLLYYFQLDCRSTHRLPTYILRHVYLWFKTYLTRFQGFFWWTKGTTCTRVSWFDTCVNANIYFTTCKCDWQWIGAIRFTLLISHRLSLHLVRLPVHNHQLYMIIHVKTIFKTTKSIT